MRRLVSWCPHHFVRHSWHQMIRVTISVYRFTAHIWPYVFIRNGRKFSFSTTYCLNHRNQLPSNRLSVGYGTVYKDGGLFQLHIVCDGEVTSCAIVSSSRQFSLNCDSPRRFCVEQFRCLRYARDCSSPRRFFGEYAPVCFLTSYSIRFVTSGRWRR